jgi:hypothetical protein
MPSTIITKNSSTASSVPSAASLTQGELAVNVTDKRLYTKDSGGTVVEVGSNPSTLVLPSGSANGVTYLNGSKVVTSGSALWFDGTNFGVGTGGNTLNQQSVVYKAGANAIYQQVANGSTGLGATNGIRVGLTSAGVGEWYSPTAAISYIDNTEQMRLTSTGLGIGTSSPSTKVEAAGNIKVSYAASGANASLISNNTSSTAGSMSQIIATNDASRSLRIQYSSSGGAGGSALSGGFSGEVAQIFTDNAYPLSIGTSGVSWLNLSTTGNLGLGVTPSASWAGGYTAFQMQNVGRSLAATGSGSGDLTLAFNAVYDNTDGRWEYAYTGDKAGRYSQTGAGNHVWYVTNTTGTAGNAITFTQAMTLDASGNLGIGTTSASGRLNIDSGSTALNTNFNSTNASGVYVRYQNSGTSIGDIGAGAQVFSGGTAGDFGVTSRSGNLVFGTNSTERARIDSSGNLLVGKTSTGSAAGLTLYGQSTISGYGRIDFNKTVTGTVTGCEYSYNGTPVGTITYSNTATAYNTSSDYRLKNTIAPMTGALAKVVQLKPVTYKWNVDGSDGEGFIAHELAEVCPHAVTGEKDAVDAEGNPKYQGIDTSFLVATLTAAIQELNTKFEAYKASHP